MIAQVATNLSGKGILNRVMKTMKLDTKFLITDDNRVNLVVRQITANGVVNHHQEYANCPFHFNTIDGFGVG